jgi:hypothetical protein
MLQSAQQTPAERVDSGRARSRRRQSAQQSALTPAERADDGRARSMLRCQSADQDRLLPAAATPIRRQFLPCCLRLRSSWRVPPPGITGRAWTQHAACSGVGCSCQLSFSSGQWRTANRCQKQCLVSGQQAAKEGSAMRTVYLVLMHQSAGGTQVGISAFRIIVVASPPR